MHARFLLTHLPNPAEALDKIRRALRPNGIVVIEDIDFKGYLCYPDSPALCRYVELYTETVRRRSGDANIGPRLPSLLISAGFSDVETNVVQPTGMQAGNLRQNFDTIVIPDQAAQQIAQGYRAGAMPSEFCGGLGAKGAEALKDFAAQGGAVILFNHASDYATEVLGVKAKNVLRGVATKDFYSPGSLLNVSLDLTSPLAYGMPENITVWSEQSPAWQESEGHVVAKYPSGGVLASGWLLGEKYLVNQAALVDANVGGGHVILFGMRPQYRGQSYQNFKLLFNALVAYVR